MLNNQSRARTTIGYGPANRDAVDFRAATFAHFRILAQ